MVDNVDTVSVQSLTKQTNPRLRRHSRKNFEGFSQILKGTVRQKRYLDEFTHPLAII